MSATAMSEDEVRMTINTTTTSTAVVVVESQPAFEEKYASTTASATIPVTQEETAPSSSAEEEEEEEKESRNEDEVVKEGEEEVEEQELLPAVEAEEEEPLQPLPPSSQSSSSSSSSSEQPPNLRQWFVSKLHNGPPHELMAALGFCDPIFVELCIQTLVVRGRNAATDATATTTSSATAPSSHVASGGWNQAVCWPSSAAESTRGATRESIRNHHSEKKEEEIEVRCNNRTTTATTAPTPPEDSVTNSSSSSCTGGGGGTTTTQIILTPSAAASGDHNDENKTEEIEPLQQPQLQHSPQQHPPRQQPQPHQEEYSIATKEELTNVDVDECLRILTNHLVVAFPCMWADDDGGGGECTGDSGNNSNTSSAATTTTDEESLYITLDTTNHRSTSELLSALDGLSSICFHRSFLWFQQHQQQVSSSESASASAPCRVEDTEAAAPLYAFLLARLERAVLKAWEDDSGTTTPTTTSSSSSSVSETNTTTTTTGATATAAATTNNNNINHKTADKLQTLLSRREHLACSLPPQLFSELQIEHGIGGASSGVSDPSSTNGGDDDVTTTTTTTENNETTTASFGSLLILMPFPYLQSIFLSDKNNIEDWKDVNSRIGKALTTTTTTSTTTTTTTATATSSTQNEEDTPAVQPLLVEADEAVSIAATTATVTTATSTPHSEPSTTANNGTNGGNNNQASNKKRSKKKKKRKNKNRASGAGDAKDPNSSNATVESETNHSEKPTSSDVPSTITENKIVVVEETEDKIGELTKSVETTPAITTSTTTTAKNVAKNTNTPKSDGGGRGGKKNNPTQSPNGTTKSDKKSSSGCAAVTPTHQQQQQPTSSVVESSVITISEEKGENSVVEVPVASSPSGENPQRIASAAKTSNTADSNTNHNSSNPNSSNSSNPNTNNSKNHHERSNHHHHNQHRRTSSNGNNGISNSNPDNADWETVSSRSRGRKGGKNEKGAGGGSSSATQQQLQANNQGNGETRNNNNKGNSSSNGNSNNNGSSGNSNNNKDHSHQRGHRNFHNHNNNNQYHSFRGRKNNATRKIAREILYSVLDGVDDQVKTQTSVEPPSPASFPAGRWAGLDSDAKAASEPTATGKKAPAVAAQDKQQQLQHAPQPTINSRASAKAGGSSNRKQGRTNSSRTSEADREKKNPPPPPPDASPKPKTSAAAVPPNRLASPPADQGTAPTYQETVSAFSTASNTVTETLLPKTKEAASSSSTNPPPSFYQFTNKGEEGIGGSTDGVDTATHPSDKVPAKNISPDDQIRLSAPPLPTLLSPENANSTTSSVASSLEAPNGRNQHHNQHHPSQNDPNAVGYHLLNVCDQLSNDMALFMKSRSQALSFRRNERSILLGALQEVVSGIWPNPCRVEMYGSCATLLDLPSSDLDVVVVGLDHRASGVFPWNSTNATNSTTSLNRSQSSDTTHNGQIQSSGPPTVSPPPYMPPPFSANAHRVMKLSAEIERLPWAVKVKSIPSATVPVIKILADPSKIPGFSTISNEWQGYGMSPTQQNFTPTSTTGSPPENQPWRGSDLMNGLISLDITFQGPEHGGLGSTDYSLHVVNHARQESGHANPDDTPFVQCLMVLKELLAQRKLNEPYSGGLSSYALLLLLTALLRERAAIREEIERAEQLRQSMGVTTDSIVSLSSAEDLNQIFVAPYTGFDLSQGAGHGSYAESKVSDAEEGRKTPQARGTTASWASVARSTEQLAASSVDTAVPPSTEKQAGGSLRAVDEERKPISFADAVAKSKSASAGDKNPVSQPLSNKDSAPSSRRANGKKDKKAQHQDALDGSVQNKKPEAGVESSANSKRTMSSDVSAQSKKAGRHRKSNKNNGKNGAGVGAFQQHTIPALQADHCPFVPTFFPQGFDDVIEVLCLGETTSGKLLMHFLLHYGQYFDSMSTAIDISGKHERVLTHPTPYFYLTPFIERSAPESIDPHTGMLVVDHIVIYDPLEGAEDHNVARRCFAWQQVRWIFAQSYATLSRAVEKSASTMVVGSHTNQAHATRVMMEAQQQCCSKEVPLDLEVAGVDVADSTYPLLRCLLSF